MNHRLRWLLEPSIFLEASWLSEIRIPSFGGSLSEFFNFPQDFSAHKTLANGRSTLMHAHHCVHVCLGQYKLLSIVMMTAMAYLVYILCIHSFILVFFLLQLPIEMLNSHLLLVLLLLLHSPPVRSIVKGYMKFLSLRLFFGVPKVCLNWQSVKSVYSRDK